MTYAPSSFWDSFYQGLCQDERDLNPTGRWAASWLPFLDHSGCARLLDLGCGTGGDCLVLAQQGLDVTGIDYSQEAVMRAQEKARKASLPVVFLQADMTQALPFPADQFDAVMSNVAFHSFPDPLLRSILKEIARVLRPSGLFLFYVNSLEDMQYRPKERAQEIEPAFYRESDGQTMHFFSEAYCRDLLQAWQILDLTHVHFPPSGHWTDKCVWRGIAQKVTLS
jgi:SAM-dependent methyltransferase